MNKLFLVKTFLYRVFSFLTTGAITFFLTGNLLLSFTVGLWDSVFKIFVYYIFEYLFDRIFFRKIKPCVIWMTGLSGAGKTTIANEVKKILTKKNNRVVILDGDEIRNTFPSTGFDEESRKAHNKRVAYMANLLKEQGNIVIVSLISPYQSSRNDARELCGERFFETYISTDLETCEIRDVKGLYAKARKGEISFFTGIDSPYEVPTNPEILINTNISIYESAMKIIGAL